MIKGSSKKFIVGANCVRPNGSSLIITSTAATIFLRSLRTRLAERFRVLSCAVTHCVFLAAACRQNCVCPNGSSLVITSTAATIFLRSLRARLAERFRVLGAAARRQGTPCEGSLRKNIPLECFSTLLRFVKHKGFRSLRRATRALPLTYEPLKRLKRNF